MSKRARTFSDLGSALANLPELVVVLESGKRDVAALQLDANNLHQLRESNDAVLMRQVIRGSPPKVDLTEIDPIQSRNEVNHNHPIL